MNSSKWLNVLLVVGVVLASIGLTTSAKQLIALRSVTATLPSLQPTSGPAIERSLQAADLSNEQKRWITQAVKSQQKEAEGLHGLATSFLESWTKAMEIQLVIWVFLFFLLGAALLRARRA